MSARLNFSRKTRAEIILRANGKCEGCGAVLKSGEGDADHILPDALGGKPVAANGQWLCKVCHKQKTAGDVRKIRKSDRQRDKASGAMRKPSTFAKAEPKSKELVKALPPRRSMYQEE